MSDFGLDLTSSSGAPFGIGHSYLYVGKLNSRELMSGAFSGALGSTNTLSRVEFNGWSADYTEAIFTPSWGLGQYMIFAQETATAGLGHGAIKDAGKSFNTSVLCSQGDGKLRFLFMRPNRSWESWLHNTWFYLFKRVTASDQATYGLNLYNQYGELTFTSSGKPLQLEGFVDIASLRLVDGNSRFDWDTSDIPAGSAILSSIGNVIIDSYLRDSVLLAPTVIASGYVSKGIVCTQHWGNRTIFGSAYTLPKQLPYINTYSY